MGNFVLYRDEVDGAWIDLVNSLSGLFCSSFNFVTLTNTIQPIWSFSPEGLNLGGNNASHQRYANLPREIVCTENLTPWKKLLPCESHVCLLINILKQHVIIYSFSFAIGQSGLGELLNAKNMYDSNYHSLALDLRPICRVKLLLDYLFIDLIIII